MSYNSHYKYDIFISYAHTDNEPNPTQENAKAWVTEFHNAIQWNLNRQGITVEIWRDKKLNGNSLFDEVIKQRIDDSALFLALHSRNFQKSAYCKQEVDWFIEHNKNDIKVAGQSRIFNILINDIDYKEWSEPLSGTSGFPLYEDIEDGDFAYPTEDSTLFREQVTKVVKAIALTLKAIMPDKKPTTKPTKQADQLKIFIADTTDSLTTFKKRLINEIADSAEILPSLPPPYEAGQHEIELDQTLTESHLTIHLLDEFTGRQIEQQNASFSQLQTKKAIKKSKQSLVWVNETLDMNEIEDAEQKQWLTDLENNIRDKNQFEFVRTSQQSFIDQVKQTINNLQKINSPDISVNLQAHFLIDTHVKDQNFAFQLATHLSAQNIQIEFNQESDNPTGSLDNFEKSVKTTQNLIIIFGEVSAKWLEGRLQTAIKTVTEQLQTGNVTLETIWVFVLPSAQNQKSLKSFPKFFNINYLNNTTSDQIDSQNIKQLLAAIPKGEAQ